MDDVALPAADLARLIGVDEKTVSEWRELGLLDEVAARVGIDIDVAPRLWEAAGLADQDEVFSVISGDGRSGRTLTTNPYRASDH